MTNIGGILYCHATQQTPKVGPGHWFFHTGQWAQCAESWEDKDGRWRVRISFAPFGKELPADAAAFGSIEEVQRFVSEYFETTVTKVKPSDMPDPEDL
jgi:hypothetical protein